MPEEQWKAEIERRIRVLETTQAVNSDRYESIKERLDRIDGHVGKIMWLVISSIASAFMLWILNGGLAGV